MVSSCTLISFDPHSGDLAIFITLFFLDLELKLGSIVLFWSGNFYVLSTDIKKMFLFS